MPHLLYFAWVKERMGKSEESLALPPGVDTVRALADWLRNRDEPGQAAFANPDLIRVAVNQSFADPSHRVEEGDEVAFFPPVTGG